MLRNTIIFFAFGAEICSLSREEKNLKCTKWSGLAGAPSSAYFFSILQFHCFSFFLLPYQIYHIYLLRNIYGQIPWLIIESVVFLPRMLGLFLGHGGGSSQPTFVFNHSVRRGNFPAQSKVCRSDETEARRVEGCGFIFCNLFFYGSINILFFPGDRAQQMSYIERK